MQSSLRQKLDQARGAGPDETTVGVDQDGPEADEPNTVSLNGSNGHPASVAEVCNPPSVAAHPTTYLANFMHAMPGCFSQHSPPFAALSRCHAPAIMRLSDFSGPAGTFSPHSRLSCMQDQEPDIGIAPPIPQDLGDDLVGPAAPPEEAHGVDGDAGMAEGLGGHY